jgi:ketosteroid isomerase-like protein
VKQEFKMDREILPAMSQENIEQLYRAQEALNQRDLDAFLALHDHDVEIVPRILKVEGGDSYRGHDGLRTWWETLHGVFPDFSAEIDEVRDLGDLTLARVRLRGQGVGSEAALEQTAWHVVEARDNKAIWWGIFLSEAEALEAAGLRE